jgi:hypothetical protein
MNMKMLKAVLACLALSVSGFTNAGIITLDFEGVGHNSNINNFYNGGTDSSGNSGTNYGIGFGNNTLGCIDFDAGGSCNIANEPSADTIMFFTSGTAILNYASGFTGGFSFFYSTSAVATIDVYSDVNLAGDFLGSINLSVNYSDNNCAGDPSGTYCNWDVGSLAFAGMAKSINFGGSVNNVGFDNITFGSTNPNRQVPEPSTLAIFALGIIGLTARKLEKQ